MSSDIKNCISIKDLSKEQITELIDLASRFKANRGDFKDVDLLKGCSIVLLFDKPSLRTRVSFELGMRELGGYSVCLDNKHNLGTREPLRDIAAVLSRYVHALVVRTFSQDILLEMAQYATAPVINALTDLLHPTQVLSDALTMSEKCKDLDKICIAYLGDGNNVLHSLLYLTGKLGITLKYATPAGREPNKEIVEKALGFCQHSGGNIICNDNAEDAVCGAKFVYTDVWLSMGDKSLQHGDLERLYGSFRITKELMDKAGANAYFMHCLPAHRGAEVTNDVIDGPRSIVYDQAENRLHMHKAILYAVMSSESEVRKFR